MPSDSINRADYEVIVGLEVHVQMSTETKIFCSDSNIFGAQPNTAVSPVSLAYPGTLPVVNKGAIDKAILLGLALNGEIEPILIFDRKHYFYPDLPKGYQISQDSNPICRRGRLPVILDDGSMSEIAIHHIHMEEDAGKSIHDRDEAMSFLDLNRAGAPLIEIVTEPVLKSAQHVSSFIYGLRQLVRWLDISDGDMEKGSMRFDCNISIKRKDSDILGQKCEIKNLNSVKFAIQAIRSEFSRQLDILRAGQSIAQSTLHFDQKTGLTTPTRSKENAPDYRYLPDPDLPPIPITQEWIADMQTQIGSLPWESFRTVTELYSATTQQAQALTKAKQYADYLLWVCQQTNKGKEAIDLMVNKLIPYFEQGNWTNFSDMLSIEHCISFLEVIDRGVVSKSIAYQRLLEPAIAASSAMSIEALAEKLNLVQTDDADYLKQMARGIIDKNPKQVGEYKGGKTGLIGFFMGQMMRDTQGKADPKAAKMLFEKLLE